MLPSNTDSRGAVVEKVAQDRFTCFSRVDWIGNGQEPPAGLETNVSVQARQYVFVHIISFEAIVNV